MLVFRMSNGELAHTKSATSHLTLTISYPQPAVTPSLQEAVFRSVIAFLLLYQHSHQRPRSVPTLSSIPLQRL